MSVEVKVENLEELLSGLDKRKEYVAKAVNVTCREFKSRAPGWINSAVTNEYTAKAKDIKGSIRGVHNVGHVTLGGVKLDDIRIEYRGKPLTLSHFKFTPKEAAELSKKKRIIPGQYTISGRPVVWAFQRRKATIKTEILKGQKKTLTGRYSPTPFIASMPTKDEENSPMLPFQRRSAARKDVVSVRTLSVPQMIMNEEVQKNIDEKINKGLATRLEHHLKRYSNA